MGVGRKCNAISTTFKIHHKNSLSISDEDKLVTTDFQGKLSLFKKKSSTFLHI